MPFNKAQSYATVRTDSGDVFYLQDGTYYDKFYNSAAVPPFAGNPETNRVTPVELTTQLAGERPFIDAQAVVPATTNYVYVAPGETVVLAGPNNVGAAGNYLVQLLYNVITSATSTVTLTDGTGVTADGYISDFPLIGAGAPLGPDQKTYQGLQSKSGPFTIKAGAGIELLALIIS